MWEENEVHREWSDTTPARNPFTKGCIGLRNCDSWWSTLNPEIKAEASISLARFLRIKVSIEGRCQIKTGICLWFQLGTNQMLRINYIFKIETVHYFHVTSFIATLGLKITLSHVYIYTGEWLWCCWYVCSIFWH